MSSAGYIEFDNPPSRQKELLEPGVWIVRMKLSDEASDDEASDDEAPAGEAPADEAPGSEA